MKNAKKIIRDISWLSFNERVLQEANDPAVPLHERIRFLGICYANLDEFFSVRIATLKRIARLNTKKLFDPHQNPAATLEKINTIIRQQQNHFYKTWETIRSNLENDRIFLLSEKQLNEEQQSFVLNFFNEKVRSQIVPLMIEKLDPFPVLNDKTIYLACKLSNFKEAIPHRYALIAVPEQISRLVVLPYSDKNQYIILLEDIIRFCLPVIFSYFVFDTFSAHIIKITRDAEIDIDNGIEASLIAQLQKGLKNRKKAKPVRFTFDKELDNDLLNYLINRLELSEKDYIEAGGRIHNFNDFTEFPTTVFNLHPERNKPFTHPLLKNARSITDEIIKRDILLSFPYHSFHSLTDLLREAAIHPEVVSIKLTCYRLAGNSAIIHALTNARRNGKAVTVVLELRARFDEAANLEWKNILEAAGVKVLIGLPGKKVHAKICSVKKTVNNRSLYYGFVSTGNLNENTSRIYGDHCLLTSHPGIMADINKIFRYLENPKNLRAVKNCRFLAIAPFNMRKKMIAHIDNEIKKAKNNGSSSVTLKMNSLSDDKLIERLSMAAKNGVKLNLIVRGICCMLTQSKKYIHSIKAISIVDRYLEHARVIIFNNDGDNLVYLSSADWMVRNMEHRLEIACPVLDPKIRNELKDILNIQLKDNVKARIVDNRQINRYILSKEEPEVRSQEAIYNYLFYKKYNEN